MGDQVWNMKLWLNRLKSTLLEASQTDLWLLGTLLSKKRSCRILTLDQTVKLGRPVRTALLKVRRRVLHLEVPGRAVRTRRFSPLAVPGPPRGSRSWRDPARCRAPLAPAQRCLPAAQAPRDTPSFRPSLPKHRKIRRITERASVIHEHAM